MPLRLFSCPECGAEFKTKQESPTHCDDVQAEMVIASPGVKLMEKTNPEKGVSALVGQQQILKERARKHSRDVEMDDLIINNDKSLAYQNRWLMPDGKRRKKIDDL